MKSPGPGGFSAKFCKISKELTSMPSKSLINLEAVVPGNPESKHYPEFKT